MDRINQDQASHPLTLVSLESIIRPTRDVLSAARTLTSTEVRYMVDAYYQMQDYRKAVSNQIGSIDREVDKAGTHQTLDWLLAQVSTMEAQVERAMDQFSQATPVGSWLRSIYGIGPVIAAGLLAHIDITRAPTAGHIWRFAGLDPTNKWEKGSKRPHNAELKTLCWKIGQCFMKFSGRAECFYGAIYRKRKEFELQRNESGGNADAAASILAQRPTHAQRAIYAEGKLPPGQIDARARRYAVKLFLSHLHEVWYETEYGKPPPAPYPIAMAGHAHKIEPECAVRNIKKAA
jgi:hypothetical protein